MDLLKRLRSPSWIVVVAATAAAVTVSCNHKNLIATISSSSSSSSSLGTMDLNRPPVSTQPRGSPTVTTKLPAPNKKIDAIIQDSWTTLVTRGGGDSVRMIPIHTHRDNDSGLLFVGSPDSDDDSISSTVASIAVVHVVILVHGWMGNPMEMNALRTSLVEAFVSGADEEEENDKNDTDKVALLVHCAAANNGNTHDGIAAGGTRLAKEIRDLVGRLDGIPTTTTRTTTLSIVGNSLGGLYARYALADLHGHFVNRDGNVHNSNRMSDNKKLLVPAIFATTATPHLGVGHGHTYLPLSSTSSRTSRRWVERGVAFVLQQTGADLFRTSNRHETKIVIDDMTFNDIYVEPLRKFHRRLAYANVHGTDFQVPTATAAFVDPTCTADKTHRVLKYNNHSDDDNEHHSMIRCIVETDPQDVKDIVPSDNDDNTGTAKTPAQLATALDRLGWTKVFCDVREHLPSVSLPRLFRRSIGDDGDDDEPSSSQQQLSSAELYHRYARWNRDKFYFPGGHTVMVANAKNEAYAKWNKAGKPVMDYLAADMVQTLLSMPSSWNNAGDTTAAAAATTTTTCEE